MEAIETIIDKAKKIKALADDGFEGEAEVARRKLADYLVKYGITLEDLSEDKKQDYDFQVVGNIESRIFNQIVYKVCGKERPTRGIYRGIKHKKWINLSARQYVEISELFEFHKRNIKIEFEKLRNRFMSAYATDHNLFPDDHKNSSDIDLEEILLINNLRQGLNPDVKFRKALKQ